MTLAVLPPFSLADHRHMKLARRLALKSRASEEVPVGAVIVNAAGIVIGRGYNRVEKKQSQLCHAELIAIKSALRHMPSWRLEACTIYITLEPCMMCLGALLISRIPRIVYGAPSHLFGISAQHSTLPPVYQAHTLIEQGLQQEECGDILKHFFSTIRAQKEADREQERRIHQQDERKPA